MNKILVNFFKSMKPLANQLVVVKINVPNPYIF